MDEEITQDGEGQIPESELEVQTEVQSDDPFDSFSDNELKLFIFTKGEVPQEGGDLLAEAKKLRAIANKRKDRIVETKPEKVEVKETPFITKSDMARIATREALELAGEEIKANYDELIKIPLGGFDSLDPKSIASNLKERLAIFKSRGSEVKEVPNLTSTTVVSGSGKGIESKPDVKDPPNFRKSVQPKDWYPKKES